ncbi:FadR family transcriptional regulator [Companilactobacillus allii]|uniref:GntR family transcriptional regulator n=1 Tax=Companilactobacillus allii TaxID=1847728 RepID=A0A1P8Q1U6_9LACO|nr:FadR/GntR family transcriptional regulator [Companilactobacillus allii]APX71797.1 GntR family transcriptional regulator [Companilactobacillus allii]USQ68884.1 FadR family transcriptional regulator [Companilactobacillus allii]
MAQNLVEQTTDKIIEYIKNNNIQPGEKLPNEYILSTDLDVGRSTFREAIRILISRNILEVRQGSGTYVSDKEGRSTDPFGLTMIRDKTKMISDFYDMRYVLEPEVASLAAIHATDEQINEINLLSKEIEQSFSAGNDDHVELDIKFHSLIAKASDNMAYSYILPIINTSISLFNKNYTDEDAKKFTVKIHREICRAIEERNPLSAHDAMLVHMSNNRIAFKRLIKK